MQFKPNFAKTSLLLALVACSQFAHAVTKLEFDQHSGPYGTGDIVGVQTYTQADGNFGISQPYQFNPDYANSVEVIFNSPTRWVDLAFSTDKLGVPLAPGVYTDAQRFPFENPGHAGLWWADTGYGPNTLSGAFTIYDIQKDALGQYTSFAASFSVVGQGSGRIWFNSDAVIPSVPEPATWAMLCLGLVATTTLARQRKHLAR